MIDAYESSEAVEIKTIESMLKHRFYTKREKNKASLYAS